MENGVSTVPSVDVYTLPILKDCIRNSYVVNKNLISSDLALALRYLLTTPELTKIAPKMVKVTQAVTSTLIHAICWSWRVWGFSWQIRIERKERRHDVRIFCKQQDVCSLESATFKKKAIDSLGETASIVLRTSPYLELHEIIS